MTDDNPILLGEKRRNAGPRIQVQLLGQLQEVLDADALVRHLLHGSELLLHGKVQAMDDLVKKYLTVIQS